MTDAEIEAAWDAVLSMDLDVPLPSAGKEIVRTALEAAERVRNPPSAGAPDSMVERVARAIDPDAWNDELWLPWADRPEGRRARMETARVKARAAIEAMREPTEEMLDAGLLAAFEANPPVSYGVDGAIIRTLTFDEWRADPHNPNERQPVWATAFRAMVDAALKPPAAKGV